MVYQMAKLSANKGDISAEETDPFPLAGEAGCEMGHNRKARDSHYAPAHGCSGERGAHLSRSKGGGPSGSSSAARVRNPLLWPPAVTMDTTG